MNDLNVNPFCHESYDFYALTLFNIIYNIWGKVRAAMEFFFCFNSFDSAEVACFDGELYI